MKVILGTIIGFITLWLFFWHIPVNGIHYIVSEGEHTGYITAVEKNGIFWKTPRVYIKTELDSSQEDAYCVVANEKLLNQLREASYNETRVTLQFEGWLIRGMSNCGGVEEVAVVKSIK